MHRALIVGDAERAEALARGIEDASLGVVRPAAGEDEIAGIAAALRRYERLLTEDPPAAVLVCSPSNDALAAVLVATKLRIPVASVEGGVEPGEGTDGVNRRLIAQLCDASLAADAGAIGEWLRSTYTPGV